MENVIDIENVEKQIEKIKLYKGQEDINFESIKKTFNDLIISYETSSTTTLNTLQQEIASKLKTITTLHNNKTIVLTKNIIKYRHTAMTVERNFNQIN